MLRTDIAETLIDLKGDIADYKREKDPLLKTHFKYIHDALQGAIDIVEDNPPNDSTAFDREIMAFKHALKTQGYDSIYGWLEDADKDEMDNVMNLMEEEL